ncbi:MAG: uroporphyrinogen-III C-methyltransferase, partial [Flavobacteriales bacterium]|nr:uroporphyrinogen-III C-methyltransferase [Flavobacteriales bacterium]
MIYLVGAGPGDPDLLTLKAFRLLKEADIVLYDSLISDEIVSLIPSTANKIYVGTRSGDTIPREQRQIDIHNLMLKHHNNGSSVVRLKSGDPFVFARGAEEVKFLVKHQIDFEVVPGITAGIAGASLLKIPLTERSKSKSILFCTGYSIDSDQSQIDDMANTLKAGSNLCMYMGYKSLNTVVSRLKAVCDSEKIFVTAISNVSRKNQKTITYSLDTIEEESKNN